MLCRMRVYLYNGTTKKMPMKFHKDSTLMTEAGKSWEEFSMSIQSSNEEPA